MEDTMINQENSKSLEMDGIEATRWLKKQPKFCDNSGCYGVR
jgi:hypothetical protein